MLKLSELRYRFYISSGGSTDERVQTSLTADKMSDLIHEIIELENDIDLLVDYLADYKKLARRCINAMDNPLHQNILRKRYLLHEPVAKFAIDLDKKQQTIKNYTSDAIKELQKILDVEFCDD